MDMLQGQKYGSPSSSWTDEKHLKFLDSVEATFVRTMLHGSNSSHHPPLPLDRHMPDSSESTQDLKSQRRKKLQPTARINGGGGGGADKKPRRLLSQTPDSSWYDQVVPELPDKVADCKGM
ncbi:hypothetical protein SAY87_017475 [Trapa incisa]|uniref:Uncharacterized protein n=1 Tax=Trapa incisa TaxID=236973 RepID=A0AAN7QW25_9MYRT|nr:hypothetical protein SAY87_017475 [Trapa incisa]